jgi:hypothetical protein
MNADDRNRWPGAPGPEEGDLLGWRTGRRRWVRLDPGAGPENDPRDDERIRDDVCERLEDADLDVGEIVVRVDDSEVILEGMVNDRFTKRAVEDIAFTVRGVRDCHNRLRLRPAGEEPRTAGSDRGPVTRVGVPKG